MRRRSFRGRRRFGSSRRVRRTGRAIRRLRPGRIGYRL